MMCSLVPLVRSKLPALLQETVPATGEVKHCHTDEEQRVVSGHG
jgi:hypothetical protein